MAEARQGQAFLQHEFDEAIVVQQTIVEAERIRKMDEGKLQDAAEKMEKQSKAEADDLAGLLSKLAVQLATEKGEAVTA